MNHRNMIGNVNDSKATAKIQNVSMQTSSMHLIRDENRR